MKDSSLRQKLKNATDTIEIQKMAITELKYELDEANFFIKTVEGSLEQERHLQQYTIHTLSEYQIGYLKSLFDYWYAPAEIRIKHVGIVNGNMIVEYLKYGRLIRENITRDNENATKVEYSAVYKFA